jgi:WD40 repeat protein
LACSYYFPIGYSDGCIGIFRVSNLEKCQTLGEATVSEEKLPVGAIRWRPKLIMSKDRLLVSAGVDGVISYWYPLANKLVHQIKPEKKFSDLLCLDYTRDASKLAAAGRRRAIKLIDDEKKVVYAKLHPKGQQSPGHSNRIFSVKFDETGKTLVSGSWDMTVKVWDVNSGTVIRSIYGPEINGDTIEVYSGGDLIVTGSHRSKDALQLWSLSYGKLVETIEWDPLTPQDSSNIFSTVYEKNGYKFFAACGSGRNEARIFEQKTEKSYAFSCGVVKLPAACSSVDFSPKENLIAVGCCDGICRIFEKVEKGKAQSIIELDNSSKQPE